MNLAMLLSEGTGRQADRQTGRQADRERCLVGIFRVKVRCLETPAAEQQRARSRVRGARTGATSRHRQFLRASATTAARQLVNSTTTRTHTCMAPLGASNNKGEKGKRGGDGGKKRRRSGEGG